jgi:hypothetical protein
MDYQQKYLKYKLKYLKNKILSGGEIRKCPQCQQNVTVKDEGITRKHCKNFHLYSCPTLNCGYWWDDYDGSNDNHCFEVLRYSQRVTMKQCCECGLRVIDQ